MVKTQSSHPRPTRFSVSLLTPVQEIHLRSVAATNLKPNQTKPIEYLQKKKPEKYETILFKKRKIVFAKSLYPFQMNVFFKIKHLEVGPLSLRRFRTLKDIPTKIRH